MTRALGALTLTAITSMTLLGCMVEEEPSASPEESSPTSPSPAETQDSQQTPSPDSVDDEGTSDDEGSSEPSSDNGREDDLPDPDDMDIERTDELGAYFSEEEACMSIGSMVEGLQTDMNEGVEEQGVLDDIYSAVEQTYLFAPEELREPLGNILRLLDTDVDALDEEEVLVAAEPVDGWLTVEFCDGQYHNQNHADDA